ncbi:MAG: D-alanyl-D-alanine carboxypeptidase/D-alanyl-D-alanine-endopeptidase [Putridiphycobacter sp.]|nr:D-alanyl-D-alanine carboxypeptidase/D-alanyl-D-alanine-endopeptidase [Putridiphycobacter sp.]
MRLFIYFLIGFLSTSALGQTNKPSNSIQLYAEGITSNPGVEHAPFSFFVTNMETGEIIADVNGDLAIPAASTMKLVTTATALQILGSKYTFKTNIAYTGTIDSASRTLNGDLIIVGGGDPTLGSKYFTEEGAENADISSWADSIKAIGIHHINGRIIADGSAYAYQGAPSGWVWGDLGNYYGAGPNGLTIYDNILKLFFDTKGLGTIANIVCTEPYIPNLYIASEVTAAKSKRDNAYVFGAPYSFDWFVTGTLPANTENFMVKAANPDPELTVAHVVNAIFQESGITIKYYPTTKRELMKDTSYRPYSPETLFIHESPKLSTLINLTNQYSINLFAEHLLCEIARYRTGRGSTYGGALIAKSYWSKKFNTSNLIMTDGSGLSRSNAVSAKFFNDLLTYMRQSRTFKNSLAIAGKKGTMSSIGRNTSAAGRVYGKSGTMSKMKAYAGYVDSKSGKKLAYAMMINNYSCSTTKIKSYFQNLMVKLANY